MIVKFGAFGDILMTTPLLTALRGAYPNAHITWIVDPKYAQAIDAHPLVDEVLLWVNQYWPLMRSTRPRNWLKNWFGLRWMSDTVRLKSRLRSRFDTYISFHAEQRPFLLRAASPDFSIGVFESAREGNSNYESLYTKAFTPKDFPAHQTDLYLLPLNALALPPAKDKRMTMGYTAEDARVVNDLLEKAGVGPAPVVLVPRTTWESKCWPVERWSALGDALAEDGHRIILMGSSSEAGAIERVASNMRSAPLMLPGSLTFRQSAALIARASLCISSDTAPMHIAAAVGTRYVSLFGPTPPRRYAPLAGRGLSLIQPVPCGPCMKMTCPNPPETRMLCMNLLTVSEVLNAARAVLRDNCEEAAP